MFGKGATCAAVVIAVLVAGWTLAGCGGSQASAAHMAGASARQPRVLAWPRARPSPPYPDPGTPHADRVAERRAPLRAVREVRVEPAVVDDQRQVLTCVDDARTRDRAAGPGPHFDAAVAVAQNRRQPVVQRRVRVPAGGEPAA